MFYAHTATQPDGEPGETSNWEPLFTPFGDEKGTECQRLKCKECEQMSRPHGHLNKVAWWTAKFGSEMFRPGPERDALRQWGYTTGLWHDLGKFAIEWQTYLATKADPHQADSAGKVDHSTAGAKHADITVECFGRLLAYPIAGHHAGLPDGIAPTQSCLKERLEKNIARFDNAPEEILKGPPQLPPVKFALESGGTLGFFIRLLFSCLVDADFLSTEAFMNPDKCQSRRYIQPSIEELESLVQGYLDELKTKTAPSLVNAARAEVLRHCLASAEQSPGLFSLTVPTGGGKTLSSLAFALKHARLNNLRRVIYVIPYTSIIEQNADVFRKALEALGPEVVLEHHCNFDPDVEHENTTNRLASENWDARLIVTTNVQFFESLHANRTSRCRKLHRIARSVIILDEAQSLPLELLAPCLRSIEELTRNYQASVVLCTATQPAITRNEAFKIGLEEPHEIIPDPPELYDRLRRVQVTVLPGKTNDVELIEKLRQHRQVLCIVNSRRHARELYEKLPLDDSQFHLSALMHPEHRSEKLETIKHRLARNKPVRLISTQLIEAGVDIDFPVVYRALAGLDSIAQAAGRCDREGELSARSASPAGRLTVFNPELTLSPGFIRSAADSAAEVFASGPSAPLDLDCVRHFFRIHYWKHTDETDTRGIHDCWPKKLSEKEDLLCFLFKKCADHFRLIDDHSEPVIIPHGKKGSDLGTQLRQTFDPEQQRSLARKLQRYTVSIPKHQHAELLRCGILQPLHENRFFLLNSDIHYDEGFGLHPYPDINFKCASMTL